MICNEYKVFFKVFFPGNVSKLLFTFNNHQVKNTRGPLVLMHNKHYAMQIHDLHSHWIDGNIR